jgi:hypothetical protein
VRREARIGEAIIGSVLPTVSIVVGYWLFMLAYNRTESMFFLDLFGAVLMLIGTVAVIASIAVLKKKLVGILASWI